MNEAPAAPPLLDILRDIRVFEDFAGDAEQLAAIAALMTPRQVAAGTTFVHEGEQGDAMFILLRGAVRITKRTLDNEQYTVAEVRGEEHAFFGELALLDAERRSATITAIEDCDLMVLRRESFENFGNAHPRPALLIMRRLAKLVSGRLRSTNDDVVLLFEALVNEVRSREVGV